MAKKEGAFMRGKSKPTKLKEKLNFNSFVFAGGGIKGTAYAGVLEALKLVGYDFSKLKNVAGTSAGAITALMLALGCSVGEILADAFNLDLPSYLLSDAKKIEKLLSHIRTGEYSKSLQSVPEASTELYRQLLSKNGVFTAEYFVKFLEKKIKEKLGLDYVTFADLNKKVKPGNNFRNLYTVAYHSKDHKSVLFSYHETPNVLIADAVRASMSIPGVFAPYCVRKKVVKNDDSFKIERSGPMLDGLIANNFPIDIFKYEKATTLGFNFTEAKSESRSVINTEAAYAVLGLSYGFYQVTDASRKIYKKMTQENASTDEDESNTIEESTKQVFSGVERIVSASSAALRGREAAQKNHSRLEGYSVITTDPLGISPVNFYLDHSGKQKLIDSGKKAVEQFLQTITMQKQDCLIKRRTSIEYKLSSRQDYSMRSTSDQSIAQTRFFNVTETTRQMQSEEYPLHYAIQRGDAIDKIILFLDRASKDEVKKWVNERDKGKLAAQLAAERGDLELLKTLFREYHADDNGSKIKLFQIARKKAAQVVAKPR